MNLDILGEKCQTNEFGGRSINIGLENVAVAVARVVGDLRAAVIRGVKSVDVYKTTARIICFVTAGTLRRGSP